MSWRLKNTELLIFGYIKQESKHNRIPKELIHYIRYVYDNWTHLVIKHKELQQFVDTKAPIITKQIEGITFALTFEPFKHAVYKPNENDEYDIEYLNISKKK
eukprot:37161_1